MVAALVQMDSSSVECLKVTAVRLLTRLSYCQEGFLLQMLLLQNVTGYCTEVCCDEITEETCYSDITGHVESCALLSEGGCPCPEGETKCKGLGDIVGKWFVISSCISGNNPAFISFDSEYHQDIAPKYVATIQLKKLVIQSLPGMRRHVL